MSRIGAPGDHIRRQVNSMRQGRLPVLLCLLFAATLPGCGGGQGGSARDRGAVVYATYCASCHQRDGQGRDDVIPSLAGSATARGEPTELIAWVMLGRRPANLQPHRGIATMPQFTWLDDADLAAVLSYVRSHFGNTAGAIDEAQVATVRAAP